jgi:Flp pilus assembly protein TadG
MRGAAGRGAWHLSRHLRRFFTDEAGAGTVFALSLLMVSALMGGLAVDVGNAWRYNELLKTTADVAAHAGAVVLAEGGTPEAARAAALAALDYNMPEARYGRILAIPASDVRVVHYDETSNTIAEDGEANAMVVQVQRSAATDNPVPTLLMRMAGRTAWDIADESVVAVVPTQRCQGTDGIYARGLLLPGPGAHVGAGYCLHSQEEVAPVQGTRFDDGAGISMPDLARCGPNCTDAVSDGATKAAFAVNLVRGDLTALIHGLQDQFADPRQKGPAKDAFFATRRLGRDLSALDEVGVKIGELGTGTVVSISPMAFSRMRALPEGLVYEVLCKAKPGQDRAAAGQGQGQEDVLTLGGTNAMREFRNIALITDCALHIDATARIEGALILTTRGGPGFDVTAEPGAVIGDPARSCGTAPRTTLMATGSVSIPAGVLGSNAGVVTANDIRIPLPPKAGTTIFGLTGVGLHAGGAIGIEAQHNFTACDAQDDPLTPQLQVIRHVEPDGVAG